MPTDYDALFRQNITYKHLASTRVTAGLTPKRGRMTCEWLPHRGNDPVTAFEELSNKFEAYASRGSNNEPRLAVLTGKQDVGDEIHGQHKVEA